ncbi:unnamed protein product [marine sediment metagenome]|uniref:Ig-like domain-containing protein n=1 Tax=marine sediment metagenome TaxID=412755 RepID=X1CPE9_9ZZZZ
MENQIIVSQGCTHTVICVLTGLENLTDYVGTLTVKWDNSDTEAVLTKVGSIDSLTITFNIDSSDNDLDPGHYQYDITIAKPVAEEDPLEYTPVTGIYTVLDGTKN